jgi:hypothetical protein
MMLNLIIVGKSTRPISVGFASEPKKVIWPGKSGIIYEYIVFPFPFQTDVDGNYIFCKLQKDKWIPIYIGQGNLSERTSDPDHMKCAKKKGATHIHAHNNPKESNRLKEEQDLLANYLKAYAPDGCNQRKGG